MMTFQRITVNPDICGGKPTIRGLRFPISRLLGLLAAGVVRRPGGIAVGWVLQVLVCLSGLLVPAMAVLGLIFLGVWVTALVYGAKGDRLAAENKAKAAARRRDEGSVTPGPSGDVAGAPSTDG